MISYAQSIDLKPLPRKPTTSSVPSAPTAAQFSSAPVHGNAASPPPTIPRSSSLSSPSPHEVFSAKFPNIAFLTILSFYVCRFPNMKQTQTRRSSGVPTVRSAVRLSTNSSTWSLRVAWSPHLSSDASLSSSIRLD